MKILYLPILIIILLFSIISCNKDDNIVSYNTVPDANGESNEINIQEEINSIVWKKLCGRAVYIKKDKYLFIDTKDSTVRIIGDVFNTYASYVKYNSKNDCITGMVKESNDNFKFDLMSIDFNGNKFQLYQSFNETIPSPLFIDTTPAYDWFPDGRLAYTGGKGSVYVDGILVSSDTTLTYFDIACLPDSNKILLLSAFNDSTKIYYEIVSIDIDSGEKSTTLLFSVRINFWNTYYLSSLRYSSTNSQILYSVMIEGGWFTITSYTELYAVPHKLIASSVRFPNWNPVNKGELTYSKNDSTYLRNIYNGNEDLVIPGGEMIAWFN